MQIDASASFDETADSWQEELFALKARLDAAERLRLSGQRGYTLEESRRRLAVVCDGAQP